MTPREKAIELRDVFLQYVDSSVQEGHSDAQEERINAVNCSLQCVDEIINAIKDLQYPNTIDYWEEVKTELETL